METARKKVYDILDSMNIPYEVFEHPAVHTIEEMDALSLDGGDFVAKNLFVRDDKKKRFFIIVLKKDKTADLKALRDRLGSRPLSFASEESLMSVLGLEKGSVTPFGVLNDDALKAEVVIDSDIMEMARVGVHPNDNTATVFLMPRDLMSAISRHGNFVSCVKI